MNKTEIRTGRDFANANTGTSPVREGFAFDVTALEHWMGAHVEGFAGPVSVEQFKGGQSNPTFKLITPDRNYVLRRKPGGTLLKGAHAVDREARIMRALHGSGFPVPEVYAFCEDDSIIGSAFFIMALVEGRIFWDVRLPDVTHDERSACFDAMNATLAMLHRLDYNALGLGDYGKPGGYYARQIALWSRQYIGDEEAGRDPFMDRLV
ncbi:MAG: phosphotransferase family protein, partial [Alphaproteobacteria bacterium]|nr:phosphotransferase family protein [Alphaproteobacteria bacterium]